MNTKLKILSILAIVFAVTMITNTSTYAQNSNIVNPTPKPIPVNNNTTGSVYGCQDGIVMFTSSKDTFNTSKGINLACIVKPFNYKAFGSQTVQQEDKSKSICDLIKFYDKSFKCPKILK